MTDIPEEKPKNRAKRRKNDWKKAIRKQKLSKMYAAFPEGWYHNLHEYSKGKIHCSCPLCAAKTNPKRKLISVGNTMQDQKRIDEMIFEEKEEESINGKGD